MKTEPTNRHPGSNPGIWLIHIKGQGFQERLSALFNGTVYTPGRTTSPKAAYAYAQQKNPNQEFRIDNGYTAAVTDGYYEED